MMLAVRRSVEGDDDIKKNNSWDGMARRTDGDAVRPSERSEGDERTVPDGQRPACLCQRFSFLSFLC